MIKVGIITISDKGSKGERVDESGPAIMEMISSINGEVSDYTIVPDDVDKIQAEIIRMVDEKHLDLVLTTGGTGLSPRDVTPEATRGVIEKEIPGLTEAMRMKTMEKTPAAILSRAVAGTRKGSIIVNLPGSVRAVRENLEIILPVLPHGLEILQGRMGDHMK
ncbi:MogA/MoaB family molybdenum cofactor biosynthesis protein [Calorimonas adulescens]|jgi:molybdopterin adenylyltransferase|uniref:Molybdenum cofactor biosynthesis protein B n=1 Tax=Calorimonas adulescens TaxID=2606906 RepID=A0A5D8QGY6_9THEO|nr:MogA/MoaB family molybdenum cofactor biosynthesis protein [Calorimonas adulescens]TZE83126.1 MogA/MoaB family molybdenum cofactor biosynthesis protein [Calorimonas adulescens]